MFEYWEYFLSELASVRQAMYLLARSHVSCFDWFLERDISLPDAQLFVIAIEDSRGVWGI